MEIRLPARQLLVVTIFIGVLVSLLLILFAIRPQIAELARLHSVVQERRNEYNALVVEENSYRTARTDFARIQGNAEIIAGLFPVKEQLVGHIERLEAAAASASDDFSLSITDSEQQASQTRSGKLTAATYTIVPGLKSIEVIPYDFTVSGSFIGVIHFLQILEHQPFYSEIEMLELSSKILSGAGLSSTSKQVRSGVVDGHMRAAFYAKQEESKQ